MQRIINDCVVDDCDDYQKRGGEDDDDDHKDNTDEKNTFFRNGSKSRLEMKRRSLRTMMVFGVDRRRMRLDKDDDSEWCLGWTDVG